jgi:hypothetical protein
MINNGPFRFPDELFSPSPIDYQHSEIIAATYWGILEAESECTDLILCRVERHPATLQITFFMSPIVIERAIEIQMVHLQRRMPLVSGLRGNRLPIVQW